MNASSLIFTRTSDEVSHYGLFMCFWFFKSSTPGTNTLGCSTGPNTQMTASVYLLLLFRFWCIFSGVLWSGTTFPTRTLQAPARVRHYKTFRFHSFKHWSRWRSEEWKRGRIKENKRIDMTESPERLIPDSNELNASWPVKARDTVNALQINHKVYFPFDNTGLPFIGPKAL